MSLEYERKNILSVIIHLNRMTHDEKISWEESDSDCYIYEARIDDWTVKIGETPSKSTSFSKSLSSDHYIILDQDGDDEILRLTDQSAIDDLVNSIQRDLGVNSKTDSERLEEFKELLEDKTEYDMSI